MLVNSLEPETVHRINISAIDGGGLASFSSLTVKVLDVNNHKPRFSNDLYKFSIAEGRYSTQPLTLGLISATDMDFGENAIITYHIIAPHGTEGNHLHDALMIKIVLGKHSHNICKKNCCVGIYCR